MGLAAWRAWTHASWMCCVHVRGACDPAWGLYVLPVCQCALVRVVQKLSPAEIMSMSRRSAVMEWPNVKVGDRVTSIVVEGTECTPKDGYDFLLRIRLCPQASLTGTGNQVWTP